MRKCFRIYNRVLIAMTLVGAVAWLTEADWAYDDYYYRLTYKYTDDWVGFDPEITTLSQAWTSVCNHIENNGRLANIVHILLQPFGHTFEAVLLGLCIAAMLAGLMWTGIRGKHPTPLAGIAAVLVMWVVFPWYDSMQSLDFEINYVPPTVAVLAVVGLLPGLKTASRLRYAAAMLAALFAAWLHEGHGTVLIVDILCCMAVDRRGFANRRVMAVLCCALAGMVLNLLLGTALRTQRVRPELLMPTLQLFVRIIPQSWPLFLAVVMATLRYFTAKADRRAIVRRFAPILAASFAGVCMAFALGRTGRVLWGADIFAAIVIIDCIAFWSRNVCPRLQLTIGVAFAIVYGWWLCELYRWQVPVSEESRLIEKTHGGRRENCPTLVFADRVSDEDIPMYLMGIVQNPLDGWWGAYCLGNYLEPTGRHAVMTLPYALEGVPFSRWPKVPGNNHLRGVWPMIAATDSVPVDCVLRVGAPGANVAPVDKLFILAKEGRLDGNAEACVYTDIVAVNMPDGSKIYRYFHEPLPRTIAHRPILSVDTIAPRQQ